MPEYKIDVFNTNLSQENIDGAKGLRSLLFPSVETIINWIEEATGLDLSGVEAAITFIQELIDAAVQAFSGNFTPLSDFIGGLTEPPEWLHVEGWGAAIWTSILDVQTMVRDVLVAIGEAIPDWVPLIGNLEDVINGWAQNTNAGIAATASAQSNASAAVSTANAANSAAGTADINATAAQTAASNAASVAAAAQETADKAYENAQYDITEFAVSTAGVILGTNEEPLGILMTKPTGWNRIITRVIYSMKTNNSTMTVKLMRRALNGTETVVHTTAITSAAITYPDNTIDLQITDLDHYFCDVTAIGGIANTLHCALETVLVEA